MEIIEKEVYFGQYCKRCKHAKLAETEEPCFECLTYPSNEYTHRPIKYEELAKGDGNKPSKSSGCNC